MSTEKIKIVGTGETGDDWREKTQMYVRRDVWKRLQAVAHTQGRTASMIVNELMEKFLEEQE